MTISIRAYREDDFDALFALWEAALSESWPITPGYLRRMTTGQPRYQDGDHFVAEADGQVVGFVATQNNPAEAKAGIPLLMIQPDYQRQGIGTRLHTTAMDYLRPKGVTSIKLAHGGDYFWPGVPLNLPGAVDFFKACGWQFSHTSSDLTRDLIDYQTPDGVIERVAQQGINVRPASVDEAPAVLTFEWRTFPFWAKYFQMTVDAGRYGDIIAAWDGAQVVGALLFDKADIQGLAANAVWHQILGDDFGGIGAVGTDEFYRERGIGLAMVATASEILRARGVRQSMIDWTDLLSFYGRLGYKIWRSYAMAED